MVFLKFIDNISNRREELQKDGVPDEDILDILKDQKNLEAAIKHVKYAIEKKSDSIILYKLLANFFDSQFLLPVVNR